MIRSMYTATSGMLVRGTEQFDMLANNLANVGTPGFKAQYLHQLSHAATAPRVPTDVQVALGRRYEDTAPGQNQFTGEDLDLSLEGGDFFFSVALPGGGEAYTRNGHLRRDNQGWILDGSGNRVMGEAGPLAVPAQTAKIGIDRQGNLVADGVPSGRLRLVEFSTDGALPRPLGHGLYEADASNPARPATDKATVLQGYIQRSNVNTVQEMIRLMESVRAMESYQKFVISASDETTAQLVRQTGRVG